MRRFIALAALTLLTCAGLSMPAAAQDSRVYSQPVIGSSPVSHCETAGVNCGRGGAKAFCVSNGYSSAESWTTYTTRRAISVGDGSECRGGGCVALSNVNCVRGDGRQRRNTDRAATSAAPPQVERFQEPESRGYAVDHCARVGRQCGQEGADLYCRSVGYERAKSFETNRADQTLFLGAGRVCRGSECNALRRVICFREAGGPIAYDPPEITRDGDRSRDRADRNREDRNRADRDRRNREDRDRADRDREDRDRADRDRRDREKRDGADRDRRDREKRDRADRDRRDREDRDRRDRNRRDREDRERAGRLTPPIYAAPVPARTYTYPRVSGLAVDHCATFGSNCGRGGADALCRSQGYEGASDWTTFLAGQTFVLGSNRSCTFGGCTGFSSVTCIGSAVYTPQQEPRYDGVPVPPTYAEPPKRTGEIRRFSYPQINGLSIDQCAGDGFRCERGGPVEYCRSQGFVEAVSWNTYRPGATWFTETGQQCTGARCIGVTDLACAN